MNKIYLTDTVFRMNTDTRIDTDTMTDTKFKMNTDTRTDTDTMTDTNFRMEKERYRSKVTFTH